MLGLSLGITRRSQLAPPSPSFFPTSDATLFGFIEPTLSTLVLSGSNITSATDLVTPSRLLTPISAGAILDGSTLWNGFPTFKVTTSGGESLRTTSSGVLGNADYTMGQLVQQDTVGTSFRAVQIVGQTGGHCGVAGFNVNNYWMPRDGISSGDTSFAPIQLGIPQWVVKIHNSATGYDRIYVNGRAFNAIFAVANSNVAGYGLAPHSGGFSPDAHTASMMWWNAAQTDAKRMLVERWVNARYALSTWDSNLNGINVIPYGDSNTRGAGASDAAHAWTALLNITAAHPVAMHNCGTDGQRLSEMATRFNSDAQLSINTNLMPLRYHTSIAKGTIWSIMGGTNDYKDSVSHTIDPADITSLVAQMKSFGGLVLVMTVLPSVAAITNGWDAARLTYNTWLAANWQAIGADAFVDVCQAPLLNPADPTRWNVDGYHINDAGHAAFAAIVQPTFNILASRIP